jgi:hypothetical protein
MHEDSPPPFIVIRTPHAQAQREPAEPYDAALVLAGIVHRIVGSAETRYYLRDRLDRAATALVFELGRARTEVVTLRWRNFRAAGVHAADVATVLDILIHQESADAALLRQARALVGELLSAVTERMNG